MKLLEHATTNCITESCASFDYLHSVFCFGSFDGATAILEGSPDNKEWFCLASFSAKGMSSITLCVYFVRAIIINAGHATCLNLIIV